MKNELPFDTTIWEEFQKQAKKRRKKPFTLLNELMREQLEIWETVELVRQYRREKRLQKAALIGE